jgi:hypothetical protein
MIDAKHWQAALAVQSACNLSGVVISFAEAMKALCAEGLDTDSRNRHPIAILFATQIAHLTGINADESMTRYSRAYGEALEIAKGKE